jgi:hypothetical protein
MPTKSTLDAVINYSRLLLERNADVDALEHLDVLLEYLFELSAGRLCILPLRVVQVVSTNSLTNRPSWWCLGTVNAACNHLLSAMKSQSETRGGASPGSIGSHPDHPRRIERATINHRHRLLQGTTVCCLVLSSSQRLYDLR